MKVELQCGDTITIPTGCKATIKDGSVVFEKEQKFKDGDILTIADYVDTSCPFIYKNTDERGSHSYYVGVDTCNLLSISYDPHFRWGDGALRYATEEEKQFLFDKMKEQGLKWNAEEKRVEKIRWRAEDGRIYFCIDNQGIVIVDKECGYYVDKNRHEYGNYFHTKEQAEEAAKRMKEVLRQYHEEIGE